MRWNVCASAVRSCPCGGIWDNEHNTHHNHFTSLCPGLRTKNPFPKVPPRPYRTIKFIRPRFKSTALRTTPWHANNLAAHTAHPLFLSTSQRTPHTLYFYSSSDTPRSSALRWNFCASAVRSCTCGLRVCVRRRLLPSVRLLHTFSRWFLSKLIPAACCGCLLRASSLVLGSSFSAAACSSPSSNLTAYHLLVLWRNVCTHTMQRNVPTADRYLDDWGDQLFRYTFIGLSLCGTYMCSAAVLLFVCVCRIRVRVRTCHTASPSSSAPAVQIPSIICECRCVHGTAYTLRTQHGHSSVCMYRGVHTALAVCST